MIAGYGGIYRATVLNDVDPMGQRRLQVQVPEVFGDRPVWAAASLPVGAEDPLPAVGEAVWVSFEHGDTDYPVWERDRKSTRLNSSHVKSSYAVFCLKKKK